MINFKELPFYIQFTLKLLMITLFCVIIIYGQNLIIPLVFSILLSILLLPITNFLENKGGLPKTAANLVTVVFALTLIAYLIYFFSQQMGTFLQDIPTLKRNLQDHFNTLQHWIQSKFHISSREQTVFIKNATGDVQESGGLMISQTFSTITHTFFYIILIAIYSFLILYYRHMIRRFIVSVFIKAKEPTVNEILIESKIVVQRYMLGLVIEMGIIAILNCTALLLIGVKYFIFLGIFSAILNIIPYVGILTGIVFTILVTLTTSRDLSDIIWIIVSFEIIHFLDANFLMPKIVGSKVKINALVTIIGVVAGGTLVGLPGIFLALPVIAILKIIFDRIDEMKPWGLLMGDDTTPQKAGLYKRIEKISLKRKKKVNTLD